MPEFLALLPPAQALDVLFKHLPPHRPTAHIVDTTAALGCVTASEILSPEPLPAFPRSAVDGYAVKAADTYGASDALPAYLKLVGEISMGSKPALSLQNGQAALVHTGGMLPEGCDAVVMIENTQTVSQDEIEILKPVAVGDNTLKTGEDVEPGQQVLPAGKKIGPADIGGLLALGILQVPVVLPPRVGILSSGDEVVPAQQTPELGQVRDINSHTLSALSRRFGGNPIFYGIVPDHFEALETRAQQAIQECDMVIITAGSSASVRDLTATVIQKLGEPGVLVHGVNIRPGKPTILAVCNGKAVIGLPGNPVSALVIAGLFVVPVIRSLLGLPVSPPSPSLRAHLTVNIPSQAGREDWIPVRLLSNPEGLLADPIFFKSNLILTLAKADGMICIAPEANGIAAGEIVDVFNPFG